jgi:hypothetical protein
MPDYEIIQSKGGLFRAGVRYREQDNRVTGMYSVNDTQLGYVLDVEFEAFTGRPPIHVEATAADADMFQGVPTSWDFDCVPLEDGGRDLVSRTEVDDLGNPRPVIASYSVSFK